MRSWLDDLHHALRTIRRAPGFTIAAVGILALGIGANAAIFSLVDTVLFRPLQAAHPERLVRLFTSGNDAGGLSSSSWPAYLDYAEQARSFESLAAYSSGAVGHFSVDGSAPARISTALVTANYFDTLGIVPAAGRFFIPADQKEGAEPVVVIAHRLWERSFARDRSAIGRSITINSRPFTVVGVAPPSFWGTNFDEPAEIWSPVSNFAAIFPQFAGRFGMESRGFGFLDIIGRLRPGVSIEQAGTEVEGIAARRPVREDGLREPGATLRPALEVASGTSDGAALMKRTSWILLAVVLTVLLIACADVAGLLLLRTERRRHEVAIRLAMGISRVRLIRQILMESVLLALLAAAGSVAVAIWCVRLFIVALPPDAPFPFDTTAQVLDARVLAATAAIAVLSGLLFGFFPALRASGRGILPALKMASARSSRPSRLGSGFVIVQVTLATVLLATAGLLIRTLVNAGRVDPGFEPPGKVVATIDFAQEGYSHEEAALAFESIVEELRRNPLVRSAGLAKSVPVQRSGMRHSIAVQGYEPPPGVYPNVDLNIVTPGYLESLGLRMVRGRGFTEADRSGSRDVVIVSRSAVEAFWGGRDPLGETVGDLNAEVIGVVEDVRARSLREDPPAIAYRPFAQFPMSSMTILVAGDAPERELLAALFNAVRSVDPDVPLHHPWTLREKLGYALAQERLMAGLLTAFALLALVLAAGGLYSLIAYTTQLRRKEFGIRIALGAAERRIAASVLAQTLGLSGAGIALGIALAALTTRFAETLLFGVAPLDLPTFLSVALILGAVGAAAGQVPAWRAMKTDPANVLRHE